MKKEDKTRESLQQEHVRIRRRQGYAAAEKRLSQKSATQCFVDESEIIGISQIFVYVLFIGNSIGQTGGC